MNAPVHSPARSPMRRDSLLDHRARLHRVAEVLGDLVDDLISPDVDSLGLPRSPRVGEWPYVEADDDRIRGGREQDVRLGDRSDTRVHDPNLDLVGA